MNVAIPNHHLEAGSLPAVCAKTGATAERTVRLTSSRRRSWYWLALLFGPLAFALSWLAARDHRVARLPVTAVVRARYLCWLWASRLTTLSGLLMFVDLGFRGLFGAIAAGGVLRLLASRRVVGLRHRAGSTHVVVTGVHPHFASALHATVTDAHPLTV